MLAGQDGSQGDAESPGAKGGTDTSEAQGTMDSRAARHKQRILDAPYEICIERARHVTSAYRRTRGKHPAYRAAEGFENTVQQMTCFVLPEERIAGNRSSKVLGTVLPVERGDVNIILELELDALLSRPRRPFHIDPGDRRELEKDILPWWRGRTLRERKNALLRKAGLVPMPWVGPRSLVERWRGLALGRLGPAVAPPGIRPISALRGVWGLLHNNPGFSTNVFDVQGHLILGHGQVLPGGFREIRGRATSRLAEVRATSDTDGRAFLEAVIRCADAVRELGIRMADAAQRAAASAADPARREELLLVAERCRRVPWEPSESFADAVQALWLTQVAGLVAYGLPAILAVGRLDQLLYPYYAADIEAGRTTEAEATALLEELLLKLGSNLMVLPHVGTETGNELGSDSCAPTIGGVTREGEDAVNPLTYRVLEAFGNVGSTGNTFAIRLSRRSPPEFWRAALGVYRRTSGAALHNDEVVISALEHAGYTTEDARDYGIVGCVEPTGQGDTFGCTSGNDVSLVAALEMALLRGRLRMLGRRFGPDTGDPRRFYRFDELLEAFKSQVIFLVDRVVRAVNIKDRLYRESLPAPLVSATLRGCVERARDMTAGGADYNFGSVSGRGFGTLVNSLAALRWAVFDTGQVSMGNLLGALAVNFVGHQELRQRLARRAPVYGADDPSTDALAEEVSRFFCELVASYRTTRGGPFRPGFFSYGMHVLEGLFLGATPDGRLAGEPVSNSFSPSNGSERQGLVGVMHSVTRPDHRRISNGLAVNVKLVPSLFESEEDLSRMKALIETYFELGGQELSPNVVSTQTLRQAQERPEAYRDLVVRVSGYSAYFTELGGPLQDEIIARTELGG